MRRTSSGESSTNKQPETVSNHETDSDEDNTASDDVTICVDDDFKPEMSFTSSGHSSESETSDYESQIITEDDCKSPNSNEIRNITSNESSSELFSKHNESSNSNSYSESQTVEHDELEQHSS